MSDWKTRTALLYGEEKMKRLANAHVLVVGLGGVGAYAAEMLVRAGVGKFTLVDSDTINTSNINRQLPALHSTVGEVKIEVLSERFRLINPEVQIELIQEFIKDEGIDELFDREGANYDFVVDAIDTLSPKCFLIAKAFSRGHQLISSMGAGAKKDITKVCFGSVWKTTNCKLSRAVRKRLKRIGVTQDLPVVYSTEAANPEAIIQIDYEQNKKSTSGTVSYMPAVFGCYLAEYVLERL